MTKIPKIFTIGSATVDVFVRAPEQTIVTMETPDSKTKWLSFPHGSKIKVDEVHEAFGGGATNTAVTFSRMGFDVCFLGKVGEENGEKALENLRKEGVDCQFAKKTNRDKTGFSTIINTFDGDRTLLAYPGANRFFSVDDLPLDELAKADWIFLNHLSEEGGKIHMAILKLLKRHPHIRLAWNPGKEQIKEGVAKWKGLLARTEVLFLNKEEARLFTRTDYKLAGMKEDDPKHHVCENPCFLPPYADDVTDILKALLKKGVTNAVITDGRNGSQASDGNSHYFCPVLTHKRVDTLGAGDAFASGFTAALIERLPLKTALKYGTLNAGSAVMRPGAQNGLLNKKGMEKSLKNHKIDIKTTKL